MNKAEAILQLKTILNATMAMSEQSVKAILDIALFEQVAKGNTFIARGKHNQSEYFVLKGIVKSYLSNNEGDDITISFFQDNAVLSPHTTRTRQGISIINFMALTDLDIISLNATTFEQMMIDNPQIRDFGNTVLRNELASKVEKEIGLVSLSAKERLLQFRNTFPLLENLVPHPDIASYLGITNISLSRLRKELSR